MVDSPKVKPKEDQFLLLAIEYVVIGMYPAGLFKHKKRAVHRKAINAIICNFASINTTLLTPYIQ